MARTRLLASITLVLFAAAGWPSVSRAQQATPYEMNAVLALSGAAAFIGTSEQQSLQSIETITARNGRLKGRPLHFFYAEDQSNPQISVQRAIQLAAKNLPVIVGHTFTATCLAVGRVVAKAGPVESCFAPSVTPPKSGFAFSARVFARDDAVASINIFRAHGWTGVGLRTSTNPSGQQFERYFDEALEMPENSAICLAGREHFNRTDLSVSAQAERVTAAAPQAMIAWSAGAPTGTLLRGVHDAGLEIPTVAGNGNLCAARALRIVSAEELYFPGRRSLVFDSAAPPAIRRAQQTYFDAFKEIDVKPNIANPILWDPA